MHFKRTLCAIGLTAALSLGWAANASAIAGTDTDRAAKDAAYAAFMETHAEGITSFGPMDPPEPYQGSVWVRPGAPFAQEQSTWCGPGTIQNFLYNMTRGARLVSQTSLATAMHTGSAGTPVAEIPKYMNANFSAWGEWRWIWKGDPKIATDTGLIATVYAAGQARNPQTLVINGVSGLYPWSRSLSDSGHYVFLYAWNSDTHTVSAGEVARNRVGYYTSQPAEGVRKALKNGVML